MAFFRKRERREVWSRLSRELQGSFEKGNWFTTDVARISYKDWLITFDTFQRSTGKSSVPFTRIRAPFVNRDDFKFSIFPKRFYHGLGKLLGMQDVVVGYSEFDKDFIIQGNDERKLKMFFSNALIRELLFRQPNFQLCIKEDGGWFEEKFPSGVNELYFESMGHINQFDQLFDLYDLFCECLSHLHEIGSAEPDEPPLRR